MAEHLIADIPVKAWIRRGGEILLIEEPDGQWTLPGGRMHVDELPEQTLVREMKEETGLDISVGNLFDYTVFTSKSGMHHFVVIFTAQLVDEQQEVLVDEKEGKQVKWIKIADVPRFPIRPEFLSLFKKVF